MFFLFGFLFLGIDTVMAGCGVEVGPEGDAANEGD